MKLYILTDKEGKAKLDRSGMPYISTRKEEIQRYIDIGRCNCHPESEFIKEIEAC